MAIGQILPMKSRIATNNIPESDVFAPAIGLLHPIYGVHIDWIANILYKFTLQGVAL